MLSKDGSRVVVSDVIRLQVSMHAMLARAFQDPLNRPYLNVQPDIPDLERGLLPDIHADKVGRVLVEYVNMPQPIQEELLANRARKTGEERHGG